MTHTDALYYCSVHLCGLALWSALAFTQLIRSGTAILVQVYDKTNWLVYRNLLCCCVPHELKILFMTNSDRVFILFAGIG